MDGATVAVYEHCAAEWAERRGAARDDLGTRFRAEVGVGAILDAGCGAGRYLGQLGPHALGLDAAAALLGVARGRTGLPVVHGDLERLPFSSGSFAGLFARHTYLHLPKDRVVPALREASRVLGRGGRLLLTVIGGDYEGRALPDDDFPGRWFSLWQAGELGNALRAAGFDGVRVGELSQSRRPSDLLATATAP